MKTTKATDTYNQVVRKRGLENLTLLGYSERKLGKTARTDLYSIEWVTKITRSSGEP